jgi:hypothetical protein
MALNDYFLEKYNSDSPDHEQDLKSVMQSFQTFSNIPSPSEFSEDGEDGVPSAALQGALSNAIVARHNRSFKDHWAIEYISLSRSQGVTEAFDDDASGFISVKEANIFTSSRPVDWR